MKILALIPARSGSKSIKDKNIRHIAGKPLLAYSIDHALSSQLINRIIISTYSKKYGGIAKKYGAEFPFLRPENISGDLSTDFEVFEHAINWLSENENYLPDICVHLRPTYPLRDFQDIDSMIRILIDNPEYDAVRSIAIAPETPYKMPDFAIANYTIGYITLLCEPSILNFIKANICVTRVLLQNS